MGNGQHVKNAKLKIVVYKHGVCGEKGKYEYQICSI
jgi:hypothetical protein